MNSISQTPNSRIPAFDLMRIIAAFGVVVLHVNPMARLDTPVLSSTWHVMNIMGVLFSCSVQLFFMISGALLLSPERGFSIERLYRKRLPRLGIIFLFWSALYAVTHCLLYGKGKWTFLNQFIRGHYHMWFLFAIAALYWITPLLRQITASRDSTRYLLLSCFMMSFVFPRLMEFLHLFPLPHMDVLESLQSAMNQLNPYRSLSSIYYYVLGYSLFAFPPSHRRKTVIYLCSIFGFLSACFLNIWQASRDNAVSFTTNTSLPALAMAAGAYLFILSLDVHPSSVITHLSRASLGIYLLHPFLLERFSPVFSSNPILLSLGILGWALLLFIFSAVLSVFLSRIPKVGSYFV